MRQKDIPNIGHQKMGTSQTAKTIVNHPKDLDMGPPAGPVAKTLPAGCAVLDPWLRS